MSTATHAITGDGGAPVKPERPDRWLQVVRQAVGTLRFGVVQVVVHDGQVTQIERTERMRFEKSPISYDI